MVRYWIVTLTLLTGDEFRTESARIAYKILSDNKRDDDSGTVVNSYLKRLSTANARVIGGVRVEPELKTSAQVYGYSI